MAALKKSAYTELDFLYLNYGDHVIEMDRGYQPTYVIVQADVGEDGGSVPVCHGDMTYVATTITDTGFILNVKVRRDSTQLLWVTVL